MGMQKLSLRAGLNTQRTALLNEGGWSLGNLIRFREGMPEVYGGWTTFMQTVVQGVCRGLHAWTTLSGMVTAAAGTHLRLYLIQGSTPFDITPIVQTTTPTSPFTTAAGSQVVTVSDSSLTVIPVVGSFVEISAASAVGGLTLAGEYTVASIINSTSYTCTAASAATSTATGGGTPTIAYLLTAGSPDQTPAAGWSVGSWGAGTWGTARSSSVGIVFPRIWTLDSFGEQLVACPRGGGIYAWLPSGGTSARATPITNAPTQCNAVFVSNAAEQIIALGSTPAGGGTFNPMLVSWCDYGNYNVWLASSSNAAGSFPLTDGSMLMWGGRAVQQSLIWTDTALYGMQFLAGSLIYGFPQLGAECGLIAPGAAVIVGNAAYWMSGLNFMSYNGTVMPLDCPVRDAVYGNINLMQLGKIICSVNVQFTEVRWDYPSANSTENDSFVVLNYLDHTWTLGANGTSGLLIARTAWIDYGVLGNPVAFDATGASWSHESGYSAGGQAMPWYLQSGEIDIANGDEISFVDMLIPDQKLTSGSMAIWVMAHQYPNQPYVVSPDEPFQVTSTTTFLTPRVRGRQIAVRFDNTFNAVGQFWRLGALRIRTAPDGKN